MNKIYPIEVYGNAIDGIRYSIKVYSGHKELNLIIDTGSTRNCILKGALNGCSYTSTPLKVKLKGSNKVHAFFMSWF